MNIPIIKKQISFVKVSTPERKRSKSRSDFSLRSCGDTHCVSKPVRPTGGTNWSEDVNLKIVFVSLFYLSYYSKVSITL